MTVGRTKLSRAPASDDAQPGWRGWYVAALSRDLRRDRPLARRVAGRDIVLFRDRQGHVAALDDVCPHRNVPLSLGRVHGGHLECGYHGWTFDRRGRCVRVPGLALDDRGEMERCHTQAVPAVERDGLVWVEASPSSIPPLALTETTDAKYTTLWFDMGVVRCDVANVLENFIDQLHPAFLHRGLAYTDARRTPLDVRLTPVRDGSRTSGLQVEYFGETLPSGAFSSLTGLSADSRVEHRERFLLPTTHQIEGVFGPGWRFFATQFCTPVDDVSTRVFSVLSYRAHVLGPAIAPVIRLLVQKLLRQDYRMLEAQRETIDRRGQRFRSTVLDRGCIELRSMLESFRRGQDVPTREVDVSPFVAEL